MKQFFKYFLASGLAYIVFGTIFLFIAIGIISSKFNSGPEPIKVEKNTILQLELNRPIGDRTFSQPMFNGQGIEDAGKMGINSIINSISYAKTDDKIKGMYLKFGALSVGLANLEELRDAIEDFKSSGKFIVSYSEGYTQGTYYLASLSDEIYLYPTGSLMWSGLSSEKMFFKNMLDKLEVDVQIIRGSNNKFKSAVEPFFLDKMSDANREQTEKYMFSFWNHMVGEISKSRGISAEELNKIADEMSLSNATKAVDYKFVTAVKYEDEVHEILKKKVGVETDKELKMMKFSKYMEYAERKLAVQNRKFNIAMVYANGDIVSGKGGPETIGSETTVKHLTEARLNDSVKAVVLRINSPGGSALASDVIWREIELIKKAGKPVVVSMGDLAASGGYYIACNADRIFAQENTITGSIGVFGVIPNAEKFFENKMGITFDRAKTNEHADIMSISKPLSDEEYKVIQMEVDRIYDDFISKVAIGRKMTKDQVDSIGQGRVWSGMDAIGINLVDEIGGIEEAVNYAAKLAKLDKPVVLEIPRAKTDPFQEVLKAISQGEEEGTYQSSWMQSSNLSSEVWGVIKAMQQINVQPKDRIQARLPYVIKIN